MKRTVFPLILASVVSTLLGTVAYGQVNAGAGAGGAAGGVGNTGNQGASNGGANQTAPTTTASPLQGAQFGQLGQTPWFQNANVRSQLNLSDAQYKQMSDNYIQSYQNYQNSLANIGKDLSPQVRRAQASQLYNNFQRNFDTSLNSIYNDPKTRQRYNELNMQYHGYNAFNDPTIQSRLNLNPDQTRRFNEYQNDLNTRYNSLQDQYAKDPSGFNTQYEQLMLQRQNRINNTLTPDQQQQYNSLTGQPYNFTPDYYFNVNSQLGPNNANGSVNSGVNAGAGAGAGASGAAGTGGQ